MQYTLRVHIIPISNDEPERAALPAIAGHADRIYFIRFTEKQDLFPHIYEAARKQILESGIINEKELKVIHVNFYDFPRVLQVYAQIIRDEQNAGNSVFFNISTGGKLNALTGMLACQTFGAIPYFCKKSYKRMAIHNPPQILEFPRFPVSKPPVNLIQFLKYIQAYMQESNLTTISKKECVEVLKANDPDFAHELAKKTKSGKNSGIYNLLKFRYLDKLIVWGYIEIDPRPRGKIHITSTGIFALDVFACYYGL